MKTVLILCDGMRPDALDAIPEAQEMMKKAAYAPNAQTVMPSVTLPCHMSLFHSVDPDRHCTTTNDYMPQVRPIPGLCEVLSRAGKNCALFYDWEQLRDLTRPSSLYCASFRSGGKLSYAVSDRLLTDEAIVKLKTEPIDFTFLYMGDPDATGHGYGWMGEEYIESVQRCWRNIARLAAALGDDVALIITADHGGHGRGHGADIPEDMTIPVFVKAPGFTAGSTLTDVNIKDLAPTVTALLGVTPAAEWEGKALI
ncbi:MAG: alkaline phosphatase family protein [Clostridia bacterium]|nr:alkaline phosphatase family protein [Clostridia bacterium]